MEKQVRFRMAAAAGFVLGLLLFLTQTRSSGTAPEAFKLSAEVSTVAMAGLALIVIAIALLAISFLITKENTSKA